MNLPTIIVISRTEWLAHSLEKAQSLEGTQILWAPTVEAGAWMGARAPEAIVLVGDTGPRVTPDDAVAYLTEALPDNTVCSCGSLEDDGDEPFDLHLTANTPAGPLARLIGLLSLRIGARDLRRSWSAVFGADNKLSINH